MAAFTLESPYETTQQATTRGLRLPHIKIPAFISHVLTLHRLAERTQEVQEKMQAHLDEKRHRAERCAGYLGSKAVLYPAHGTDIDDPAFDAVLDYTEGSVVEASGMILQATAKAQQPT